MQNFDKNQWICNHLFTLYLQSGHTEIQKPPRGRFLYFLLFVDLPTVSDPLNHPTPCVFNQASAR
jgi:hypothetical protein